MSFEKGDRVKAIDDVLQGEIVEVLGVVALFGYLNRWNDSMGTEIEEPAAVSASSLLGHKGWEKGKHQY